MADESLLKQLTAETRTKLRSAQILTSLPIMISELMQNAIDAGASQIDIGVDCAEWGCWVMDNGSGITKEGLRKLAQDSENGRYNSSKAYTPATLDAVSTFGFRGEALASMADLACMEISSRTARSRDSWSVIVKGGKSLYIGPSIRWRRESSGTVVSIRDAFFSLPVRRQSHPAPNRTIELIRQEVETYALVFPDLAFSLQDTTKSKSYILRIPKTRSTLTAFRHFYGRAFTECAQEISATCGQLQIKGFVSLVGAHTKSHQLLYINRHPIAYCDLHRLIDTRFAASTFAKHAYDEGGETSLRPSVRRCPRKGEKKPVYVLNLVIPVHHIDNCLEPSKSAIELDNKNIVTSFLSRTIQSFLVNHNFAPDKTRNEFADGSSPTKKRKLNSTYVNTPSGPEARNASDHMMPVAEVAQMALCNYSSTPGIDNHTANFRSRSPRHTAHTDTPIQTSLNRRTLQLTAENNRLDGDQPPPNWLREALQANDAFSLQERKIPSIPAWVVNQDTAYRSSVLHNCHTGFLTNRAIPSQHSLPSTSFTAAQIRFRKDDLRQARIISQIDCKFIACVVGLGTLPGGEKADETRQAATGATLILIDQHAADERVRVERFLKSICRGFLSHQEGSGGVETRQLSPPVPVLLTQHEASRLAELLEFRQAFESWGFRFFGLEEIQSRLDSERRLDDGYVQIFVSAVPDIVSEKLLSGKEMQGLIQGYIGALESRELEPREPSTQQNVNDASSDEETQWIKALRWCPRQLLDLINSKACRGAIMFNDPLSIEQCERLVKQLSTTVFPFQCAHGRPSLVPLMCLGGGRDETGLEWEKVATL